MPRQPNLLDPNFEPTDEELAGLMERVAGDVQAKHRPKGRAAEKQAARERDAARLAAGEKVDNGFFSVLDRSKAKLLVRRAKIRIDPE
ncbi:MAG: hypothetical protein K2Y27_35155 [Xanthobacteraceae bacterium]|nr:hypothetical protein [Xanthobacteraceae bacterium]